MSPDPRADALNAVAANLEAIAVGLKRTKTWLRLAVAGLALAIPIVIGLGIVTVQNRAIIDTIRDCTSPEQGGECAKRNQQQTGKAIQNLIRGGQDSDAKTGECVVVAKADSLEVYRTCLKGYELPVPK